MILGSDLRWLGLCEGGEGWDGMGWDYRSGWGQVVSVPGRAREEEKEDRCVAGRADLGFDQWVLGEEYLLSPRL